MTQRHHVDISWKSGARVRVEFALIPPDSSVGIMGYASEDHTLHDPRTNERLFDLEDETLDAEWDEIADKVDNSPEFEKLTGGGS